MNASFIERDRALKTCPDRNCRRSGQCRAGISEFPCARTHAPIEACYNRLATKLDRLARELPRDQHAPDRNDPDYDLKLAFRMAELKRALEERDRELA